MSALTLTEREADKNAHDSRAEMLRVYADRAELREIVREFQMTDDIPKT